TPFFTASTASTILFSRAYLTSPVTAPPPSATSASSGLVVQAYTISPFATISLHPRDLLDLHSAELQLRHPGERLEGGVRQLVHRSSPTEVHRHHQHTGPDLIGHPGKGLCLSAPAYESDLLTIQDIQPRSVLRVDLHVGFRHLLVEDLRPAGL